jgi:hypothetical protein
MSPYRSEPPRWPSAPKRARFRYPQWGLIWVACGVLVLLAECHESGRLVWVCLADVLATSTMFFVGLSLGEHECHDRWVRALDPPPHPERPAEIESPFGPMLNEVDAQVRETIRIAEETAVDITKLLAYADDYLAEGVDRPVKFHSGPFGR